MAIRIFLNEKIWISLDISLKFVHESQINNIPALAQIMAWCRPEDKPSEPLMVSLLTHISVTRPQSVNELVQYIHGPELTYRYVSTYPRT